MLTANSTNFPGGVTNAAQYQAMGQAGTPDPSWSQLYHNEFNTFVATDFTTTLVGTGTSALVAESGGVLLATTTAGAADANYYQLPVAGFKLEAGSQCFFKCRIKLDNATLSDVYCGLIAVSATPLAATEGLFLYKAAGAATWVLRSIVGGVTTDTPLGSANVVAANVWQELSFYVDKQQNVAVYFNPTTGPSVPTSLQVKGYVAVYKPTAALSTAMLTPSFGIRNSSAVARTMRVDYLTVSNELLK